MHVRIYVQIYIYTYMCELRVIITLYNYAHVYTYPSQTSKPFLAQRQSCNQADGRVVMQSQQPRERARVYALSRVNLHTFMYICIYIYIHIYKLQTYHVSYVRRHPRFLMKLHVYHALYLCF